MTPLRQRMIEDLRIRGLSQNTIDSYVGAIPCAKTPTKLPDVLHQDELLRLFAGITNIKHRAIAMTIYAAGLRVSEVAHLQIADIDGLRMLIHVRQGKGAKDRLVPLSPALQTPLREYYRSRRPEHWLFPGQRPGTHINSRSVHHVLVKAALAALGKPISPHVLRHSCATHMLEACGGIRVVQGFLGHRWLPATDRYSHVSREQITATKSPLDLIADAL